MNNIRIVEVQDNSDVTKKGTLYCQFPETTGLTKVIYTTPYLAPGGEGGFYAIPEEGSRVMVIKPDEEDGWYYMSTICDDPPGQILKEEGQGLKQTRLLPDNDVYAWRGVPQKMGFKSPAGHALTLVDGHNAASINQKAELRSGLGKRLSLIDSPDIDCIFLRNEHRDGLKITSDASEPSAARSIELECQGPMVVTCRESQMDLLVYDGRELNIINESNGSNRSTADPERYGNVNMRSRYRDINFATEALDGRVFLDALGLDGLIQVDSNGTLRLYATKNVEIFAGENIILQAGQGIRMSCGVDFSVLAGTGITLDGVTINLNTGLSLPQVIIKIPNHYGE